MVNKTIKIILLLLFTISLYSKSKIAFYTLKPSDKQNNWHGLALIEQLQNSLRKIDNLEIIEEETVNNKIISSKIKNPDQNIFGSFKALNELIKPDYIITGAYSVKPDKSMPVNIVLYEVKTGKKNPFVVQGYANDLPTIVSYFAPQLAKKNQPGTFE